ncbi:hypothetical protein K2173_015290 [Erythroxylum novogranatense]|uniref:Pentatricopeptide repeat-containing protein n=1 Tax=Erythroxylum novogranatense TaxID=1862640 RepID=A0AAV8T2Y0_9ROSI|nr:hypothetical protein K2173_015290 [Erythroxylum novogranatense]
MSKPSNCSLSLRFWRLYSLSTDGFSSFYSQINPCSQSSSSFGFNGLPVCAFPILNFQASKCSSQSCFRSYSASSYELSTCYGTPISTQKQVSEIVNLIRSDRDDLESKLDSLDIILSLPPFKDLFEVLNREKLCALRFFRWLKSWQPEWNRKYDVCSLVIANCGHLDDYDAMKCILEEFKQNGICLTSKAFGFLPITMTDETVMRKSIKRLVCLLHEVGGSCYSSGIHSLIRMYCSFGLFGMAKFVMESTERKISYYNLLILEMCRRSNSKGARKMLAEMREEGCDPSAQSYNYVISSLLKNGENADAHKLFQEMQEKDCPPNALTFEIFICNACKNGNLDIAMHILDGMVALNIEPRLGTHAAVIKGYFKLQQDGEAYKYIVNFVDKFKFSSNMNYSLLARLHHKGGNLVVAHDILSEMMSKGFRPNFNVYWKVLKKLKKSSQEEMAIHLQRQFLKFESKNSTGGDVLPLQ